MGLVDKFWQKLGRNVANSMRSKSLGSLWGNFYGSKNAVAIDDDLYSYVEDGYTYNHHIYSVINSILQASNNVPLKAYKIKNKKAIHSVRNQKTISLYNERAKRKALEELEGDHYLSNLLARPNPHQTQQEFEAMIIGYYLITGNSYLKGDKPENGANAGIITQMFPLPAHEVEIEPNGMGEIVKYIVDVGVRKEFDAETVVHIKNFNPSYDQTGKQYYGMSPLRAGRWVATRSNDAIKASVRMLQNMYPPGILVQKDTVDRSNRMTEAQSQKLKDKFHLNHGGADNANDFQITSASLEWIEMGRSATDLQLNESMKQDLVAICNLYNMPPALMGLAEYNAYNNQKEAKKALYTDCVLPNKQLLAQAITKLCCDDDHIILPDTSQVESLQEDMKEKAEIFQKLPVFKVNEIRKGLGYDDLDDPIGEEIVAPANLMPLGTGQFGKTEVRSGNE